MDFKSTTWVAATCLIVAIEKPFQLGVSFDPGNHPKRYVFLLGLQNPGQESQKN